MGSSIPFSTSSLHLCKLRPKTSVTFSPWKHPQSREFSRGRSFVCALEGKLQATWIQSDSTSDDDRCGGWSVYRVDAQNRDGFLKYFLSGIGTSVLAVLLAGVAYCTFSRKCFKLKSSPPSSLSHDNLAPSGIAEVKESAMPSIHEVSVESTENYSVELKQENKVHASGKNKCIVVTVPADPTQLEALYVLKKLKIIDYDATPDDLCTKREYARWLVKANSILERKTKHRIVPMSLIPGFIVPAFDDVSIDDPDFWCIQALGEAGIVSSRLSSSKFSSYSGIAKSEEDERFYFFPDNFISLIDLLNWRALLEYSIFSELEKTSRTKLCLSGLNTNKLDVTPQLLMDLMSGDGSIVRKTFGNIRRIQPEKPITKAQAAVSLSTGRMAEAIHIELSRLEAEELSRLSEMEEIRVELIHEGVTEHWEEKIREEKKRALQVDSYLESALFDLEMERKVQEERLADYMKAKADLECQQHMLLTFKKDVDEMSEKLVLESAVCKAEKQMIESQLKDLHEERDAAFEAKSVLEAEKEAIQILRSWVEEEARKIQARAMVLGHAARRWRFAGGTALSDH